MAADDVAAPRRPPVASGTLIGAALAGLTLVLYGWRLGDSPLHLHYDEVFFGLQAHSIAGSARDLNGHLLPVYFQLENTANWYQPMAVYWSAFVLQVLPLSDAAVRLPTVLVAAIDVVLMFFVARRITGSLAWATVAGGMLMLTPAHFIHSRLAMDYVYPLPFVLGWLLWLLRYHQDGSHRDLFGAGLCLGLASFSYIAATALAPMLLLATGVALLCRRSHRIGYACVAGGFAVPILAAVIVIAARPDTAPDLLGKYGVSLSPASRLDPLQRMREAVNVRTVSDALNHYWRFFSPGYLFVTGGSNLTNSTRAAGVFTPAVALLLAAGLIAVIRRLEVIGGLLVFGLLVAPVPASAVPEDYTIDRHLVTLVFAVLLATLGARAIWQSPWHWPMRRVTNPVAVVVAVASVGYAAFALAMRGQWSSSAPLLLLAAAAISIAGIAMDRTKSWRPIAAAALLLVIIAFVPFVRDYFREYPLRSSNWFGGNVRGAIESAIGAADQLASPEIYVSNDIPYMRSSYWPFYLKMFGRTDLAGKTRMFDRVGAAIAPAPGAIVLAAYDDQVTSALAADGLIVRVASVGDVAGGAGQFTIFRAVGSAPR